MDLLQQLHDVLTAAAGKLEDTGEQVYADTAAKVRAKAAELAPLLKADAADAEARALELVHSLFGTG